MRQPSSRIRWMTVAAVALLLFTGTAAHAALKAAGPINAVGFPAYYQDLTGFSLVPCLDQNAFCILPPPFDGATPITAGPATGITALNFPSEWFYWFAEATIPAVGPTGGDSAILRMVLEGAFATGTAANGQQMAFLRVNLKAMRGLTPGTYTVTYPFGSFTFTADAAGDAKGGVGNQAFRSQDGGGGAGDFTTLLPATATGIGPFLKCATGPVSSAGNVYIGSPAGSCAVTGATNNFFRITGPNIGGQGINTAQTDLFALSGKMDGVTVSPASFAFAPQNAPGIARTTTFTVTNIHSTAVTLGIINFTGPQADQFALGANSCTASLAPNATCTFDVVFTGLAPDGTKSAEVNVPVATPNFMPPGQALVSGVIDAIPPTVLSTNPAGGSTVPSNTTVTAVFSEPMLASTITATTFVATGPTGTVTGTVSYDAVNNTATFVAAPALVAQQTYTASLTAGATDIAGNGLVANTWSFATVPPDFVRPTVSSTSPANNTSGAPVNSTIKVTFSEPMHAASINETTFTVSSGVTGSITYDAATNTATLTPTAPLQPGTPYTATITTGVDDLAQNQLAANFTWTFLTNNPPSAPGLVSPADGAIGQPTSIVLTWTKATDPDGDTLTYQVTVCNNEFFLGCSPDIVTAAAPRLNGVYFAGMGGFGMAVIGLVSFGGITGRKRFLAVMLVVLLMTGMGIAACGGGGGGGGAPSNEQSFTKAGLNAGGLYYWKVAADDSKGVLVSSETRTFRTQQ